MQDFIPIGTGNSRYLKSVENFKTLYPTYDAFAAALVAGTLPVDFNGINEAGVLQKGMALNKYNLLKDATAALFGLGGSAVPDDVFNYLGQYVGTAPKTETGSYVGTGTYDEDNPCILTFDFEVKCLLFIHTINLSGDYVFKPSDENERWAVLGNALTTEYQLNLGPGNTYWSGTGDVDLYSKKSSDGKTIYWYAHNLSRDVASNQYNTLGATYYYIAFG